MSICYFVDQRLLSFYALLFTWVDVFATEFPDAFDREEIVDWIQNVYVSELKHYYDVNEHSKTGKSDKGSNIFEVTQLNH